MYHQSDGFAPLPPHREGFRVLRYLLAPALLGCFLSIVGFAAEAPPVKGSPSHDELVRQLGDNDFRRRDAATDQLLAAGAAALPALRRALNHPDPEIRKRVGELVPTIETAALMSPKRVTLKVENKTLKMILDEVTRQTGFKIEHWANNPNQGYSFSFTNTPFWEALDRICQETGMVVQQGYGDDRLRLQQQDAQVPFIRHEGPFRYTANGFQHYRNIDFSLIGKGAPPSRRTETLTFTFSVFVEPRLPLLGMGEVKLNAAFDSEKNSMLVAANGPADANEFVGGRGGRWTSRYGNGYRTYHLQAQVNLNRPSEKATSVRVLRGTVPVTLLAEQKEVVITDNILTAKGKKFAVGSTTFLVEDINEQPNKQYQLKLSVTEDNKDNPNDYTWMNALYQRIELHDPKGAKFQVFGSNWGNSSANHVQLTMTYGAPANAKIGPPAKFIYYAWTTLVHQAPFEFKDLPLP